MCIMLFDKAKRIIEQGGALIEGYLNNDGIFFTNYKTKSGAKLAFRISNFNCVEETGYCNWIALNQEGMEILNQHYEN